MLTNFDNLFYALWCRQKLMYLRACIEKCARVSPAENACAMFNGVLHRSC